MEKQEQYRRLGRIENFMNIVIKNQNFRILDGLNIEIIKTLTGEFTIEEITQNLINMYYNKAIIDITAIKNYYDINSVITFLRGFDPTKIIILLNDNEAINSNSFLGKLVENGIYNFTRNAAGINYLLDHPNSQEDVIQYTKASSVIVVDSLNPTSAPLNYSAPQLSSYETEPVVSNSDSGSYLASNSTGYTAVSSAPNEAALHRRIIGIQNLTEHAGATTLAYMMVKQLKFNYRVKGIEMNKQDFLYFRDSDLTFCTSIDDFNLKLRGFEAADVIVVDLNNFDLAERCDEIIYLIDPGIIKVNKLIKQDSNVLSKVANGKVVLNRSSIKQEDVGNFEYETKFKVFFNMPNFSDRKERIQVVDEMLYKLGFAKQEPGQAKSAW